MGVVVLEDRPGDEEDACRPEEIGAELFRAYPGPEPGKHRRSRPGRTPEKRSLHVAKKSSSSLMLRRTISRFRATIFPRWRSAISAKNSPGALLQMVE